MSRYIDLDKLLDALCDLSDTENGDAHFMNGINTAIEVAESMVEKTWGKSCIAEIAYIKVSTNADTIICG